MAERSARKRTNVARPRSGRMSKGKSFDLPQSAPGAAAAAGPDEGLAYDRPRPSPTRYPIDMPAFLAMKRRVESTRLRLAKRATTVVADRPARTPTASTSPSRVRDPLSRGGHGAEHGPGRVLEPAGEGRVSALRAIDAGDRGDQRSNPRGRHHVDQRPHVSPSDPVAALELHAGGGQPLARRVPDRGVDRVTQDVTEGALRDAIGRTLVHLTDGQGKAEQ